MSNPVQRTRYTAIDGRTFELLPEDVHCIGTVKANSNIAAVTIPEGDTLTTFYIAEPYAVFKRKVLRALENETPLEPQYIPSQARERGGEES